MDAQYLEAGTAAPEFSALNQRGESVQLHDYRGQWVVLYFYPKAMTPGCTTQACGLRDSQAELQRRNAVVLGVSPDKPDKLQRFIDKQELNFDLLSDPETELCQQYGIWGLKKFMGREYDGVHRVTYLIDPEGVIRHVIPKVRTKTHHDDVLALLDAN